MHETPSLQATTQHWPCGRNGAVLLRCRGLHTTDWQVSGPLAGHDPQWSGCGAQRNRVGTFTFLGGMGEKKNGEQKGTGQGRALGRTQLLPRTSELPHRGQGASPHVHAAHGVRGEDEGKTGATHPASRVEGWGRWVHLEGNAVGQLRNGRLVEDQLLEDEANCGVHTPGRKSGEGGTAGTKARESVSINNDSDSSTGTPGHSSQGEKQAEHSFEAKRSRLHKTY